MGFSQSPNYSWVKIVEDDNGPDPNNSYGIDADIFGNTYITGTVQCNACTYPLDVVIAKYDESGNLIWIKSFWGPKDDIGRAVTTDKNGNINLVGTFESAKIAFNGDPLWLLRNNECIVFKPDKQPIGYYSENSKPFTKHEITIMKKDTFIIFSDGYEDQFGGPNGKKFMSKQMRELLLSIQYKNMPEQKQMLNKAIEDWKKGTEQIDDICVLGVRV